MSPAYFIEGHAASDHDASSMGSAEAPQCTNLLQRSKTKAAETSEQELERSKSFLKS